MLPTELFKIADLVKQYEYKGNVDWIFGEYSYYSKSQEVFEIRKELIQTRNELQEEGSKFYRESYNRNLSEKEGNILRDKGRNLHNISSSINRYLNAVPILLTFHETGKALRAVLPILGKTNYARSTYLEYVDTKVIGWRSVSIELLLKANKALLDVGVTDFGFENIKGVIKLNIRIPEQCSPSSFYSSDDPAVWEQKQQKLMDRRKIKIVEKRLDRVD